MNILDYLLRRVLGQLVNRGLKAGIDRAVGGGRSTAAKAGVDGAGTGRTRVPRTGPERTGGGNAADQMTPEERRQAKQARQTARRARQAAKLTRRMMR